MNMPLYFPFKLNDSYKAKRKKKIAKAIRIQKEERQKPMMVIPSKRYHK